MLLIGQQSLVDFFRYRPLLPIGWRIVQILRQCRRKTTKTATTSLRAIKAASQSTWINEQPRPLVRPSSVNFCRFFKNLFHERVPLNSDILETNFLIFQNSAFVKIKAFCSLFGEK
jgi:hypothetical protein